MMDNSSYFYTSNLNGTAVIFHSNMNNEKNK